MTARSLLFVPGNRPERFTKAAASAADLVIVDLEDAVPDERKSTARDAVAEWLSVGGRVGVRVNGTKSVHYQQDVAAVTGLPGLAAIVVPMADDPAALAVLHQQLGRDVQIVALIETAQGVVRAIDLATTPGVSRLAFGHLDFAADIDSSIEDDAMLMARSMLVLASRAAELPGPRRGHHRPGRSGLAGADAARARALGFTGKLCIHPNQVEAVNAAFSPSGDEITWANRIIEASTAGGVVRVDGTWSTHPSSSRPRRSSPASRRSSEQQRRTEGRQDRADHPGAVGGPGKLARHRHPRRWAARAVALDPPAGQASPRRPRSRRPPHLWYPRPARTGPEADVRRWPGQHARSAGLRQARHPNTWVAETKEKQGSTGPLTFVTVRHEYAQNGRIAIVDENDIVYRTPGSSLAMAAGTLADVPEPAPREPALTLTADEALLFRFSALTYNAHRIHYDHNWARPAPQPAPG